MKAIDDIITGDNPRLDDLDGIKCKLQICDGLLAFWKKCVEHVSGLEKVRAAYIASLCDVLPETTRLIFEHCKTRYLLDIDIFYQTTNDAFILNFS